jgi:glutamyl-tRNA reductase
MSPIPHSATYQILDRFCVAGINYHQADITVRGLFSITRDDFSAIAIKAKEQNIRSVFVLSTCNRTEIYGFAENVMLLVDLLTNQTKGTVQEFLPFSYMKKGDEALQHLYQVASGLDSQILGDYEILGQLKQAVDMAAAVDLVGPIMNRTMSYAFQASKKIKTDTALSSGTVSVSYAAIELLKALPDVAGKNILIIGAGKFGGNVCKNLKEYLPFNPVTICNRTDETASKLAGKTGARFTRYEMLPHELRNADIIIVCTNSREPAVLPSHLAGSGNKLILDLSVPANVHIGVKAMNGIRVIDVDEISTTILDKTFARRKKEVPKANEILLYYKNEYCNWLDEYRYSLHIKSWKDKLQELHEWQPQQYCELAGEKPLLSDDHKVQKAVTRLAVNLRANQEKGCQFINAINDYLQMS